MKKTIRQCREWTIAAMIAVMALTAPIVALAQSTVTGTVTTLRIDTAGSDIAARVKISGQAGCGGFFNVSSADATFPQMVAVLQTALVTVKPVSLTVGTGCRVTSVTISAN